MKKVLVPLLIAVLCYSCKPEKNANEAEFRLYNLAQQGWKSKSLTHQLSEIQYKATQVPLQYYIMKNGEEKDPVKVDSIYQSLKTERVIEFEFQHDTKVDLLEETYTHRDYSSAVEYMAFQMKNDFSVETESGERIVASGVHFERNFKLAPFKRVLVHFAGIPENENIKLLYNDRLFGKGLLKYHFKETPIKL